MSERRQPIVFAEMDMRTLEIWTRTQRTCAEVRKMVDRAYALGLAAKDTEIAVYIETIAALKHDLATMHEVADERGHIIQARTAMVGDLTKRVDDLQDLLRGELGERCAEVDRLTATIADLRAQLAQAQKGVGWRLNDVHSRVSGQTSVTQSLDAMSWNYADSGLDSPPAGEIDA